MQGGDQKRCKTWHLVLHFLVLHFQRPRGDQSKDWQSTASGRASAWHLFSSPLICENHKSQLLICITSSRHSWDRVSFTFNISFRTFPFIIFIIILSSAITRSYFVQLFYKSLLNIELNSQTLRLNRTSALSYKPDWCPSHRRKNCRDWGRLVPRLLGWGPTMYWSPTSWPTISIVVTRMQGLASKFSKIFRG